MVDELHFMMGEYQAEFPSDRLYARNHMWAKEAGQDRFQFGFAAYAVRLLQDVYFLDWDHPPGTMLVEKQEIGQIESQKAEASLYAPCGGELVAINDSLLQDPSAINVDKYGNGWLFELRVASHELLSPKEYLVHLAAVWEVTQQTIKGQLNK